MPKINREEYEVLKGLDERAKSIVRQAGGWLWVTEQPILKDNRSSFVAGGFDEILKDDNHLFQFIKCEDKEPWDIQELIDDYEYKTGIFDWATALRRTLHGESEETEMKKDIEWLKKEVIKISENWTEDIRGDFARGLDRAVGHTIKLINQLDEPEVLTSDWIDKHKYRYDNVELVGVKDLHNLLVPKQEKVKVPQFVADYIEEMEGTSWGNITDLFGQAEDTLGDWWQSETNFEKLARAWLYGYTVEEEQKYHAKIKGHALVDDSEDGYWNVNGKKLYISNNWHDYSGYKITKLTKDEWRRLGINDTNADFVKVEEMKENV